MAGCLFTLLRSQSLRNSRQNSRRSSLYEIHSDWIWRSIDEDMDIVPILDESSYRHDVFQIFDGIRPARLGHRLSATKSSLQYQPSSENKLFNSSHPSKCRIIPIQVIHIDSEDKRSRRKEVASQDLPIVIDGESTEIPITIDLELPSVSHSCDVRLAKVPLRKDRNVLGNRLSPRTDLSIDIEHESKNHHIPNLCESVSSQSKSSRLIGLEMGSDSERKQICDNSLTQPVYQSIIDVRSSDKKAGRDVSVYRTGNFTNMSPLVESLFPDVLNLNNNSSDHRKEGGQHGTPDVPMIVVDDMDSALLSPIEFRSLQSLSSDTTSTSGRISPSNSSRKGDEDKGVNSPPGYAIYHVLKEKLAQENREIDYVKGDGNCFFRALSKQLYGSERFHKAVRSLIIDLIATHKSMFSQFIDNENVQKHVEVMSADQSWATTCEIYAAATLLQRDIYMLTPEFGSSTRYSWLLFKPVFLRAVCESVANEHVCYLSLCNTNGNHYDRVVADHGGCNCFLPHPLLDGISCNVDLTNTS